MDIAMRMTEMSTHPRPSVSRSAPLISSPYWRWVLWVRRLCRGGIARRRPELRQSMGMTKADGRMWVCRLSLSPVGMLILIRTVRIVVVARYYRARRRSRRQGLLFRALHRREWRVRVLRRRGWLSLVQRRREQLLTHQRRRRV